MQMKELEKTYNPAEIEDRLYDKWLKGKYFHAEVNRSKNPFTIVMPVSCIWAMHWTIPCRIS